jgi:RES domain-containing protein
MLYASSHLSLAVLEVFVNIPQALRDDLPVLQALLIAVPDDADAVDLSQDQFQGAMAARDPLLASRAIGDRWLEQGATLLFRAPSVLVPEELNVMFNPSHPGMRDVTIESTRPFRFDPRLATPHRRGRKMRRAAEAALNARKAPTAPPH